MRCLYPREVGFQDDGKTIAFSPKKISKQYATFKLPCSKCIECRLEYARQWAVRCVHESKMHEDNVFITLTYSEENLKSPKLQYSDFQLFMKRLRDHIFRDFLKTYGKENWKLLSKKEKKEIYEHKLISTFVTGEYGDKTKRPHWHAIIFNWSPTDLIQFRTNDNGDRIYKSATLERLWQNGHCEIGSVTFESAGYCARYAAKKLVHGNDSEHGYHPISKKSSKHAIGKRFLEKYYSDIFTEGLVILPGGTQSTIPRYYEKWFKKNHPEKWDKYVTEVKLKKTQKAEEKSKNETIEALAISQKRQLERKTNGFSRSQAKKVIIDAKFKQLQKHLKGL